MNNKKAVIRIVLIFTLAFSPLFLAGYLSWKSNHFACESEITVISNKGSYDAIMLFTFNGGEGWYSSVGDLQEAGQPTKKTSHEMRFRYVLDNKDIVMISEQTDANPGRLDKLSYLVPDFFRIQGRGISIHLLHQNVSSYIFTQDNMPLFYCAQT
ncbi:hypothetical protein I2494_18540 [Budviciaceae bacterium BWR-B9]|uniref:FidL-like membrane protein n=1 Tax=Limnobaculum allomyrinae TaxID=2791986 RepID=A0ABS1IV89_9GAMM|nr:MULTISPECIES: hypothetical protein [Limnobaculum]MBK5145676.1 hypothetical protein [Limnobaculum allomyrinae]MBV7692621.1 hypothetical protein [Limnobaculum sp. M2-1]